MPDPELSRRATERILEDESLTADLVDDAARPLLEWGLAQAAALAGLGLSKDELDARVADLRRTMRHVGRRAGQATPDEQPTQVQALLAEMEPASGPDEEIAAVSQPPPAEIQSEPDLSAAESLPVEEHPPAAEYIQEQETTHEDDENAENEA